MDQVELGALERSLGNSRVQRQLACLNPQQHFAIELAQGGEELSERGRLPDAKGTADALTLDGQSQLMRDHAEADENTVEPARPEHLHRGTADVAAADVTVARFKRSARFNKATSAAWKMARSVLSGDAFGNG